MVKINNYKSDLHTIIFGVPQGGILSPILFNLFINDIVNLPLHGKIILYADDICLSYVSNDPKKIVSMMEEDIILLQKWFSKNLLTFNAKK